MVVRDGVGRACPALGNIRMRARRLGGVFQNARQPNVGDAQVLDGVERTVVNVVESAAAVLSLAAVESQFGLFVTEKPYKELIDVHTAKIGNFTQYLPFWKNILLLPAMKTQKKNIQPPCCWTVEELKEQIKLSLKDIEEGRTVSAEDAEQHFLNYKYEK